MHPFFVLEKDFHLWKAKEKVISFNVKVMAIARGSLSFHIGRSYAGCSGNASQSLSTVCIRSQKNSKPINEEEKKSKYDSLSEDDFEEKFIRGSGPGGQKVNKTSNCVELRHKSTGIVVKCHETRSLENNRVIARSKLLDKLKFFFAPKESSVYKKHEEKQKKQNDALRRRRLKEQALIDKVDIK